MSDHINLDQLPGVDSVPEIDVLTDRLFSLAMRLEDPADHYAVTAAVHLLRRASILGELPSGLTVAHVMKLCLDHAARMNQMVQHRVDNHFLEQEASTHLHAQGWKSSTSFTLPFPTEVEAEDSDSDDEPTAEDE